MVENINNIEPIPFDIILLTHGKLELTVESVKAIYAFTRTPFQLIVVDDSTPDLDDGTDLTPLWFEKFQKKHDNVTLLHSEIPYREGNQAFNIGLQHAEHEFVALVMNSVIVEPEWERVALQFLKENPRILNDDGTIKEGGVGVVGLKSLNQWGRIESAGIAMDTSGASGQGCMPVDLQRDHPSHRFTTLYKVEAVQWALAILRKEAVIGNLEEGVFNGFKGMDDIDNCFVVRSKGWDIFYCGYGCGIHKTRATRGSNMKIDIELNRQNRERFYKRWGYWDKYFANTGVKVPEDIIQPGIGVPVKPIRQLPAEAGIPILGVPDKPIMNRAERRRMMKVA